MEKLVLDYTYYSEPECWHWDIPFEYESKEKFISDVLKNPMILKDFGLIIAQCEIDDKSIFEQDYIKNINNYILTLDEWFLKNKKTIKI